MQVFRQTNFNAIELSADASKTKVTDNLGFLEIEHHKIEKRHVPLRKLAFDKLFSSLALLATLPLMIIIAIILFATNGGPIFFSHSRMGKDGKAFNCLKFRTMAADSQTQLQNILTFDPIAREEWRTHHKFTRDPRVTAFGRFLRRTSLDELPQFWNVLRGDMSIVGPRPISADETRAYGEHFVTYITVRPGITGVWQTSGRSNTSFSQRVVMDVDYIKNWSLRRDINLTWQTLGVIVVADGAR